MSFTSYIFLALFVVVGVVLVFVINWAATKELHVDENGDELSIPHSAPR